MRCSINMHASGKRRFLVKSKNGLSQSDRQFLVSRQSRKIRLPKSTWAIMPFTRPVAVDSWEGAPGTRKKRNKRLT